MSFWLPAAAAAWVVAVAAPARSSPPAESGSPGLAQWIEQLRSSERESRYRAANALGAIGPAAGEAAPALRAALKDDEYEVRWCVLDALGRLGEAARPAVPDLAALARDAEDKVSRRLAVRALGHLGPVAAAGEQALKEALGAEDRLEAVEAGLALWRVAHNPAGPAALARLAGEADNQVAFAACLALAETGSAPAEALDPLLGDLARDDVDVRRAAARALGMMGARAIEPLTARMKTADGDAMESVIAALALAHRQMRTGCFYLPNPPGADLTQDASVIERLSIPALAERINSPNDAIVRLAAGALGDAGLVALPALAEKLAAPGAWNDDVADAVSDLLDEVPAALPGERFRRALNAAEGPLAKSLGGDRLVRRVAARALASLPFALADETVAALRVSVNTDDPAARHYSAEALARRSARKTPRP